MPAGDAQPVRLRDFLYVDVDRMRGLLAQIEGGVVDEVVERWKPGRRSRFGARVLGVEASRDWLNESDVEHKRTLDDALLSVFEEAAEEIGLLVDVANVDHAESWLGAMFIGR